VLLPLELLVRGQKSKAAVSRDVLFSMQALKMATLSLEQSSRARGLFYENEKIFLFFLVFRSRGVVASKKARKA